MEKHQVLKGSLVNGEKQQESQSQAYSEWEKMCRSFPGRMIQEQGPIELINSLTLNYLKVSLLFKLCPWSSMVHPPLCSLEQLLSSARAFSAPQELLQREMFMLQLQLKGHAPHTPGHSFQGEWDLKYWVTKYNNDLGEHQHFLWGFSGGLPPFPAALHLPVSQACQYTSCSFPGQMGLWKISLWAALSLVSC